jgi:hypothetical protein
VSLVLTLGLSLVVDAMGLTEGACTLGEAQRGGKSEAGWSEPRFSRGRSSRVESSDCTQVLSCFFRAHLRAGSVKRGPGEDEENLRGFFEFSGSLHETRALTCGNTDGRGGVTEAHQV